MLTRAKWYRPRHATMRRVKALTARLDFTRLVWYINNNCLRKQESNQHSSPYCMKKLKLSPLLTVCILFSAAVHGLAQGSVQYRNDGGVGKDRYVFFPDPANPTVPRWGGSLEDYAGYRKVEGDGYYAQLWWAPGENQPEASLAPVEGSIVTFGTGPDAGLIKGKSKLEIPGTFGGDKVTFQLRVWENLGMTVDSWEEVLTNSSIYRGKSNLFNYQLSGLGRDGVPVVLSGNLSSGLTYFTIPIPEPGLAPLLTLGLGGLAWLGRRRPQAEGPH